MAGAGPARQGAIPVVGWGGVVCPGKEWIILVYLIVPLPATPETRASANAGHMQLTAAVSAAGTRRRHRHISPPPQVTPERVRDLGTENINYRQQGGECVFLLLNDGWHHVNVNVVFTVLLYKSGSRKGGL